MKRPAQRCALLLAASLLVGCDGCGSSSTAPDASVAPTTASGSASGTASTETSAPPSASAAAAPKPYKGPTGTIHGVVTVTGDEAPTTSFRYPESCRGAQGTYGKLFRVGLEGGLADALVAVTGYEGSLPPTEEVIEVGIKNCAFDRRTIGMTEGQHLEVKNLDPLNSYLPWLDGARMPATLVAVPRSQPVKLYSRGPQRYWLRDQMSRPFMVAHVFHLPYSTFDVTGLDGRYRIEGIPVGAVEVSVLLPAANMKSTTQKLELKEGDNELDLTLEFDADKDVPKGKAKDRDEGRFAAPDAGSSEAPNP
jgi:hypothetical protein